MSSMQTLSFCNIVHSTKPQLQNTFKVHQNKTRNCYKKVTVFAIKKEEEPPSTTTPSWAKPDSEEPPPWARNETDSSSSSELPFFVYLLASAITAIAAIGSVFEYVNEKPIFGVLNSDSIFYAPILGFFAITGLPTAGYLWFKSVDVANKEAEEQDRRDGYR